MLNLLRFGEWADFQEVAPVGASRVQLIRELLLTRIASSS